jgi:uncharacterized membrane protein
MREWHHYWWFVMTTGMIVAAAVLVWLIVDFVRGGDHGREEAEKVLASRLASGEIGADEYRERLDTLRHPTRERAA